MASTSTIDDTQFRRSVYEFSKIAGKDYAELLNNQAGSVIKAMARNKAAKPPSVKAIRASVTAKAMSRFVGTNGEIAVRRGGGGDGMVFFRRAGGLWRKLYGAGGGQGWHIGDPDWALYLSTVKERQKWIVAETRRRGERRGLLRMSFIQIADGLGVDLNKVSGPGFSQSIPRRAKMPGRLGRVQKIVQDKKYETALSNFSAAVRDRRSGFWHGQLQNALTRRSRAMQMDMRKGVLQDMQLRAKKYPGVFVEG